MRRTVLRRATPLRARVRSPVTSAARFVIWSRAGCRCEVCGRPVDLDGFDPHHRQRRALGSHGPANLLVACRPCHRHVHAEPQESREELGRIVSAHADPSLRPVRLWDGRWVLLTADGQYREAA